MEHRIYLRNHLIVCLLLGHIIAMHGCMFTDRILEAGERSESAWVYRDILLSPTRQLAVSYIASVHKGKRELMDRTSDFENGYEEERWAEFDLPTGNMSHEVVTVDTHRSRLPDRVQKSGVPVMLITTQQTDHDEIRRFTEGKSAENLVIVDTNRRLYFRGSDMSDPMLLPPILGQRYRLWWGYPVLVLLPLAVIGDVITFPVQAMLSFEPSVAGR